MPNDDSGFKGGVLPGQLNLPTKIAGPSGDQFINPVPVGGEAARWIAEQAAPPLTPREALALEAAQAERAAQAEQERIAQRKALGEQQLETVRTYAAEVAALAKAAAAIKPGPLPPLHIREAARAILHGGFIPPWLPVNHDPMVLELLTLKERGRSYT